jgi:hypothetical protein
MKLVERLKVTSRTDVSPCDKTSTNMHPSASQKTVPMVLSVQGIVFGFFSLPLCALSFCFRFRVMKPAFVTRHDAVNKVVFDIIPFKPLRGNFSSLKFVLLRQLARNPVAQTSRYPKISTISCTAECPVPALAAIFLTVARRFSLMISSIYPSFLSGEASSRDTTSAMVGDIYVPVCKMLYSSCNTVSAHAAISTCMLKSCVNIRCGGFTP